MADSPTYDQAEYSGEALDPDELGAWKGFLRTHSELTRRLDRELRDEFDLPLSSYEVLMYLADAGGRGMRMSNLADNLLLSRSGLTRIVDRLADRGLVKRRPASDDGRGMIASLSPAGLKLIRHARPAHLAGVRRHFLSHLDREQMRALARAWEQMGTG